MYKGSCLCGAVRFEVNGALATPDACHCSKCRKWSGHFLASTEVPRAALTIHGADHLTWFRSSEKVQRGFCSTCGSSLFYEPLEEDWLGISMGAFDLPTDTKLGDHMFVANKGDYYDLAAELPKSRQ